MHIFDGLHAQCADSIDVEKSDTSEDSDMEVIEQLVEPAEADLARLIVELLFQCLRWSSMISKW